MLKIIASTFKAIDDRNSQRLTIPSFWSKEPELWFVQLTKKNPQFIVLTLKFCCLPLKLSDIGVI